MGVKIAKSQGSPQKFKLSSPKANSSRKKLSKEKSELFLESTSSLFKKKPLISHYSPLTYSPNSADSEDILYTQGLDSSSSMTLSILDSLASKQNTPKKSTPYIEIKKSKATKNFLMNLKEQKNLETQSQTSINDNSHFYLSYFAEMKTRLKELQMLESPLRSPVKPFKQKILSKFKNRVLQKIDTMIQVKNEALPIPGSMKTIDIKPTFNKFSDGKGWNSEGIFTFFRKRNNNPKKKALILLEKINNSNSKLPIIVNESKFKKMTNNKRKTLILLEENLDNCNSKPQVIINESKFKKMTKKNLTIKTEPHILN